MRSTDYHERFRSCGTNVRIAPDVYIEHPEQFDVGDDVIISRGTEIHGRPETARFDSRVKIGPGCYFTGSPTSLVLEENVQLYPGVFLGMGHGPSSSITIGHDSHCAPYGVLYGWGGLDIGAYCNIAAHVVLATVGHRKEVTDIPMALSGEKSGPITLEEDVWIAANATITANTVLAKGTVIAANSVVTKDTEPMGVYAGVPARLLSYR